MISKDVGGCCACISNHLVIQQSVRRKAVYVRPRGSGGVMKGARWVVL